MAYTGAQRTQYKQAGGMPIDLCSERSLIDPTPGLISVFTDIDRLQWGNLHDWGHPPTWVNLEIADGGTTGGSGSYAAVDNTIVMSLEVPPLVQHANICALVSGALRVKLDITATDSNGVQVLCMSGAGADGFEDIDAAKPFWCSGVSSSTSLSTRALIVSSSAHDANPQTVAVRVTVTRTDISTTDQGYGGILWGLGFAWVRPPLNTFKVGTDTRDSASV